MKKNIIYLKLGGSLVTDKRKAYTFNESIVRQVVSQIAECLRERSDIQLVLGNGAGSFAHQSATKYRLHLGATEEEGIYGSCATHTDAAQLNQLIVKILLESKIPVYTLQPSAFILSSSRSTKHLNLTVFEQIITNNMIPFVYGDVIIDTDIGATIYSTDRIFREIAEKHAGTHFTPGLIIHAGNYDGVMDQNGQIIPTITRENYNEVKKSLYRSDVIDVTGGMEQKVEEMLHLVDHKISSIIINGKKKGLIKQTLLGDISSGTYITYK